MKTCEKCSGTGVIEIMGDGANFEWDVIDTKPCGECGGTGEVKNKSK